MTENTDKQIKEMEAKLKLVQAERLALQLAREEHALILERKALTRKIVVENTNDSGNESDDSYSSEGEYTPSVYTPIYHILKKGEEVGVKCHHIDGINYVCVVESVEEEKTDSGPTITYSLMPKGHTEAEWKILLEHGSPRIVKVDRRYFRDHSLVANDIRLNSCDCDPEFQCMCAFKISSPKNEADDSLDDFASKKRKTG